MKILLINGGKKFAHSDGRLNQTLHDLAYEKLAKMGHEVKQTVIDQGYDIEAEVEKFLWMDAVVWQMPAWWMGEPWIVKKYIDEVFTAGHGKLYTSDGRHRVDPAKNYGKGGLLNGKKFMLSLTWNAPAEAFSDPNEFLGMKPLTYFVCYDVIKMPDVPRDLKEYEAHLEKVFKA